MALLYRIGLQLYYLAIWLASFFNSKASKWMAGRKDWEERGKIELKKHQKQKWIWMHCASLGEFEQGRPVLEAIRKRSPEFGIVLSFFSPSGYEVRKNTPLADVVSYLPIDSPGNARRWLALFNPEIAIFVKYEFWYYYLNVLSKNDIPTILISALFRRQQLFFKPYGGFFKKILRSFHHIFVQNQSSLELIRQLGISEVSLAGDTRVDRVLSINQQDLIFPELKPFTEQKRIWIFGSTHLADEKVILDFFRENSITKDWNFIIAPHEIKEGSLKELEDQLPFTSIRYSQIREGQKKEDARCVLIDNIGMLSRLYTLGDLAYIGGGFGKGIHNILEPMAFSLPIIFGPNYQKFEEANQAIQTRGAFSVDNAENLAALFNQLLDERFFKKASIASFEYVKTNRGATKIIIQFLEDLLPLSAYGINS